MRSCGKVLFAVFLVVICVCAELQASIKERIFSLHLDLYGAQPALNDSAQIWLFSPYWGGDLQYMLSPQTGLMMSVHSGKIYNDSVSTSIFKFNNDRANRLWKLTSIAIGPKFYLNQRKGTTPYFVTRMEMLLWSIKSYPDDQPIEVTDKDGNPRDYKATEIGFTAGFGLEQLIADRIAVSMSAEFTYLTGLGANFAQWVKNSRSRAILQFGVGLSFHFGGRRKSLMKEAEKDDKQRDRITRRVYEGDASVHGDTVLQDKAKTEDSTDSIAAVPIQNEAADLDSDSDGISDGIDKCGSTPTGVLVDRDGCPLDSDNDGVFDGIDRCPSSVKDDAPHVDAAGCAPDSDLDGVPDYRDRCPNSSERVAVDSNGCSMDADKDGVEDALDQCPDTPHSLAVDISGCPDRQQIFGKQVFHGLFSGGGVNFNSEKVNQFDSVITMMKMFPEIVVTVYGYTDDVGPDDANLQLSQKRADAVRSFLVSSGLENERVLSVGRGESNFMASNQTRRGRELNRRIELEFKFE